LSSLKCLIVNQSFSVKYFINVLLIRSFLKVEPEATESRVEGKRYFSTNQNLFLTGNAVYISTSYFIQLPGKGKRTGLFWVAPLAPFLPPLPLSGIGKGLITPLFWESLVYVFPPFVLVFGSGNGLKVGFCEALFPVFPPFDGGKGLITFSVVVAASFPVLDWGSGNGFITLPVLLSVPFPPLT